MDKHITDERTGLKYELVGDYYVIAGDDEPEERPIGIWGQDHSRTARFIWKKSATTPRKWRKQKENGATQTDCTVSHIGLSFRTPPK